MIPEAVRQLAEDPTAYAPAPPGFERIQNERYSLLLGPFAHMTMAQRVRLEADEVERAVAEVREHVAECGRTWVTWWVTDSTRPADLEQRLLGLGLEPAALPLSEPSYEAMALTREPEPAGPGLSARLAVDFDEYVTATEITWDAFEFPEDRRESEREILPALYEFHRNGLASRYLCFLDGEPVASAVAVFANAAVMLIGGAVLPEARGRGCYKALVRARWDDAVARDTPALVVQAGAMSQPILAGLGFDRVATMRVFVDRFA
ncbi:MAG TPA: hypothetical protein VH297_05840 [Gaiellaceae bacterium]